MVDTEGERRLSEFELEVTPEMIAAGRDALLRLVADDDLREDPDWIAYEIWTAMQKAAAHTEGAGSK